MSSILNFFQSNHVLALLISILIFLITILLVVKRWIGFPITVLLLLFSLTAGLIINYQHDLQGSLTSSHSLKEEASTEDFHQQILQAVENLKIEVATEKENLRHVMQQVQEIFESMDLQKQKLQSFIEEVREQFKVDYPSQPSNEHSETTQERSSK